MFRARGRWLQLNAVARLCLACSGRGLMMAVQFSDECPGMKLKVMQEALNRELLLLPAGPPEILRLLPPLVRSSLLRGRAGGQVRTSQVI